MSKDNGIFDSLFELDGDGKTTPDCESAIFKTIIIDLLRIT